MPKDAAVTEFLSGGGEMGERIRRMDWSQTPLGDAKDWPQNLKTCVRIILTSRQPMFVWWGGQLINIYNDAYLSIIGGKHPQALGEPAARVWQEIWDQVEPRTKTVMEENTGTYDEALPLIMERNGYPEETYYTFSYSPVPGETGRPEGIICANSDDTSRIIGERQLHTLKDLGKNVLDGPSGTEIFDNTIEILKKNPRDFPFAFLYQVTREGSEARLVSATHDALARQLFPAVVSLNREGSDWAQAVSQSIMLENLAEKATVLKAAGFMHPPQKTLIIPVSHAGAGHPWALLVVGMNPYRLPDEAYLRFYQLVTDQLATNLNNVHAYEEERKRAETLAELDRAKTTFFSNISHEFRTPLTLMLGPLEDILQQPQESLSPLLRQNVEASHRNAMRLLKLVNSLLDFSRIEAGKVNARFVPVQLDVFTAGLAGSFESVMKTAGLVFDVDCPALPSPVYVDKEMWEKIVLNLLSNAFKYTLEGAVKISVREEYGQAVLRVADTGIGIPKEELPHMFERFHRVPNARGRTFEGTGIGLSLVQELVRLHKGNITVRSEEGAGSVFMVCLPLGKQHLPASQVSDVEEEGHPVMKATFIEEAMSLLDGHHTSFLSTEVEIPAEVEKDIKLLIVDDNADMRRYLRQLLEPYYMVQVADNGQAALQEIYKERPALVISDIMMPVMDGIALLTQLKGNAITNGIPVILLSARAGEEASINGLDAGADDYLVKPFSSIELLSRVRSLIRRSQSRQFAERQLSNLLLQAPVAIAIYRGPDLQVELANERMLEFWGKSIEDVIHRPVAAIFPRLKELGFESIMKAVYDSGESYVSGETPLELFFEGQGDVLYVKYVCEPLTQEDGTITGIMNVCHDVTDLVKSRKTLEEREAYFRKMSDTAPVIIWLTGNDGRIVYQSRQWYDYSGQDEWAVVTQHWLERVHGEERAAVEARMQEAIRKKEAFSIEMRLLVAGGVYRWVYSAARPRLGAAGDYEGHIGTIVDIHERKLAEEKLINVNQRFEVALETGRLGSYELELATGHMQCTALCKSNFGLPPDAVFNFPDLLNMILPDDRPRMQQSVQQALDTKGIYYAEYRVSRADDLIRWIAASGRGVYDKAGQPVKMVGVTLDITDRKEQSLALEQKVRERTNELSTKNEELLMRNEFIQTIFDSSVDVIAVFDSELRYVTINKRAEEVYGMPTASLQGKRLVDVFPAIRNSRMHEFLLRAFKGESLHDPLYKSVIINRNFENFYIPLRQNSERVQQVLVLGHDNTDIVQASERLRQTNAELTRINQELEQFAYVASHDLQEPLRKIQVFTEMLDGVMKKDNAEADRYLSRITAASERMSTLIRDLLNFSRLSDTRQQYMLIDLNNVMTRVQDDFELMIRQKKAVVQYGKLPVIEGISIQINQLFYNLVSNALKFSAPSRKPLISIQASRMTADELTRHAELDNNGVYYCIEFSDNGIGFDQQYAEQIFSIFQRLNDQRAYQGTGIGLALCKKIVVNHGGKIYALSNEQQGASFFVILPEAQPLS